MPNENKCAGKITLITTTDGKYEGHIMSCENLSDCRCDAKRTPSDNRGTTFFTRCVCEKSGEEDKNCVLTLVETLLRGDDGPIVDVKVECLYPYDCGDGKKCKRKEIKKEEFKDGDRTLVKTIYVCECE